MFQAMRSLISFLSFHGEAGRHRVMTAPGVCIAKAKDPRRAIRERGTEEGGEKESVPRLVRSIDSPLGIES